jgi:hypothetical protein
MSGASPPTTTRPISAPDPGLRYARTPTVCATLTRSSPRKRNRSRSRRAALYRQWKFWHKAGRRLHRPRLPTNGRPGSPDFDPRWALGFSRAHKKSCGPCELAWVAMVHASDGEQPRQGPVGILQPIPSNPCRYPRSARNPATQGAFQAATAAINSANPTILR